MFTGCLTALVTPFKKGQVDYKKLNELLEFQIAHQSNGVVITATTGEGVTLSYQEKERIFRQVVRYVRGRMLVIASTGSNDTRQTIALSRLAQSYKVDGVLVVVPYYNKPTQEGLYLHYESIARQVRLPIIIYNVPGRTVTSIAPETVARLSRFKNMVAIKEASGSLDQVSQIKQLSDITILSGEDSLTFPILCLGGKGVISVVGNLVPQDIAAMIDAFKQGNLEEAQRYHYQLYPLAKAMFIETSPIPVKTAMRLLGRLNGELRLPLSPMSKDNIPKLRQVLVNYGLL